MKEKKIKFLTTWGRIPTDWIGASLEDAGWGWVGAGWVDLPSRVKLGKDALLMS